MKRRRLLLPCVSVLGLLVAACGRGDDSGGPAAPPAGATTVAPAAAASTTVAGPAASETTGGGASTTAPPPAAGSFALTPDDIAAQCASEPLEATEVGVSATEITIEVSADVGSPLAPGLFQGSFDAVEAFADSVNANGGIGCRKLVVRTWDSKLDPAESKNGLIDACQNAVAMVGTNSIFNPDMSPAATCVDQAGEATGLPDLAGFTTDSNELCNPTTFLIDIAPESCPIAVGEPRDITIAVGAARHLVEQNPDGLRGLYLLAGDLPTTRQLGVSLAAGQEAVGITFDDIALVSGRDEQAAFTPLVQQLKDSDGNYVYGGSNDVALMKMQKEAAAQGVDPSSVVWLCTVACYTKNYRDNAGPAGDGTYVWMPFLPFEEADTNAALAAYVAAVGEDKVDSFGAGSWQAAMAFNQVVNQIVADDGPNAITRAALLEGLAGLEDFSADGWLGPKSLRGAYECFVLLQKQGDEFVRVFPEERGTFDCRPQNLTTVNIEPVSEAEQLG